MTKRATCPECGSVHLEADGAPTGEGAGKLYPKLCASCGHRFADAAKAPAIPPTAPRARFIPPDEDVDPQAASGAEIPAEPGLAESFADEAARPPHIPPPQKKKPRKKKAEAASAPASRRRGAGRSPRHDRRGGASDTGS